jgi:hypothetical protein
MERIARSIRSTGTKLICPAISDLSPKAVVICNYLQPSRSQIVTLNGNKFLSCQVGTSSLNQSQIVTGSA